MKVAGARGAGQSRVAGADGQPACVELAVHEALCRTAPLALAVSGGLDSMVLLHAAARVAPDRVALVATFDHGSGAHGTAGCVLGQRVARELGFPVAAGRSVRAERSEAGWRAARWEFLRAAAREGGAAAVATAHTEDDQLETVFMRALRGAGARGLAGLLARSPVVRPLVGVSRACVASYAVTHGVGFIDDPTNRDRRYLRNRVRHELLPAIERLRPGFRAELLALATEAAVLRTGIETLAATLGVVSARGDELTLPVSALQALDEGVLVALWPALAARVGVTLDRRGTVRLARFTRSGRNGDAAPLSGGATVRRTRDRFVLCCRTADIASRGRSESPAAQPLGDSVRCGRFQFHRVDGAAAEPAVSASGWTAEFDGAATVSVRSWAPGDRMRQREDGGARRVKRYLADARVPAFDRPGWPVVLVDGAIAWIPGVRRNDAATVRPGRPGVRYDCDRNDG